MYECLSFHPDDEDTQWDMFIKQRNGWVMPDTWKIVDMTDTNIILEDTEYIAGTRQLNCLYINYTLDNEVLHQVTFLPTAIPTMTPTQLPTMIPTNVPTPVPTPGVTFTNLIDPINKIVASLVNFSRMRFPFNGGRTVDISDKT